MSLVFPLLDALDSSIFSSCCQRNLSSLLAMPALQFLCLRFAFAFSFVRIFLCNFYMLTSDTSIRACLTICQLSSSKTPHGVHGQSPRRLPYAFACPTGLQCVAATGHQKIDLARRQLSQAGGDSFLSKAPTPIMRRRASTSRGPPPNWFTCSPCAACRRRSEVPGDPLDCKPRQCLTNKIAEMVVHQTCVPVILLTIPLMLTLLSWHTGLVHSPRQERHHLHSPIVIVVNMSTEEKVKS